MSGQPGKLRASLLFPTLLLSVLQKKGSGVTSWCFTPWLLPAGTTSKISIWKKGKGHGIGPFITFGVALL